MKTIRIIPVLTDYMYSRTKEEPKRKKDEPISSIKFDDIFKEELRELNKKEGE